MQNMSERREHFLALAENTLQEAMKTDGSIMNHILLAEFYLSEQRNDEAEAELLKAGTMTPGRSEEVAIEASLGNIAMRRERFNEALPHFKRVAELDPDAPSAW